MMRSSIDNDDQHLPKYKIIILGKSRAGKTKLLTRYIHGFYQDKGITTISVDFSIKKRQKATYWYYDTAGQQAFRSIVDIYYKGAEACIIVYDVSDSSSYDQIMFYYNKIKQLANNSLIYIIGCKSDLKASVSADQIKQNYQDAKHLMTSAKIDQNVLESFLQIQSDLYKMKPKKAQLKSEIKPLRYSDFSKQKKKKQCCKL